MRDTKRKERHEAIATAAYEVLAAKGYGGTSMLTIAKAAQASNETLYRWYGDKRGLFEAMVSDNAAETKQMLEQALSGEDDPLETLEQTAPVLLEMLLGDRAVLLNRAAAADPTGALGAAISAGGRAAIVPLFQDLIARIQGVTGDNAEKLAGQFLSLLIGDLQIKRTIGVLEQPSKVDIDERSQSALKAFLTLLNADQNRVTSRE